MDAAPIFLLGMMGAGKSSVGRELARLRGASFIDLDERVERLFATSIPKLFEVGETYFRVCERTALRSLIEEPGFTASRAVIATGGGLATNPANLESVAGCGASVYLEVSPARLAARLSSEVERGRRPLLATGEGEALEARLAALLQAREADYRRATLSVDASGSCEDVALGILRAFEPKDV